MTVPDYPAFKYVKEENQVRLCHRRKTLNRCKDQLNNSKFTSISRQQNFYCNSNGAESSKCVNTYDGFYCKCNYGSKPDVRDVFNCLQMSNGELRAIESASAPTPYVAFTCLSVVSFVVLSWCVCAVRARWFKMRRRRTDV